MAHHVFLIPGYLGFRGKAGYTGYWDAVVPVLAERGIVAHQVATAPVGRLSTRARRLCDAITHAFESESSLSDCDGIHLIGHSTGGLDARYVVSPRTPVALPPGVRERIGTVVTMATPHHGTPVADFYYAWRAEDFIGFVAGIVARWSRRDRVERVREFFRDSQDQLRKLLPAAYQEELLLLLSGIIESTPDDLDELLDYVTSLAFDRGALSQLRVSAMKAFNLRVRDAPDVRYVCYLTGVAPPRVTSIGTSVYTLGCFINAAASHPNTAAWRDLPLTQEQVIGDGAAIEPAGACGPTLTRKLSDGVVPSLSQVWGDLEGYAAVDHHTVIGRFDLLGLEEFKKAGLREVWERIAKTVAGNCSETPGDSRRDVARVDRTV